MVKGYLLIKLVPGLESSALSQICATPGVLEVNLIFGHWDAIAIAIAEANTHEILGPTTQTITNIACQPGQLNMVPNLCCISIDRRIVPGDSLEKTKTEFRAVIDELKAKDPEFDADVEVGKLTLPTHVSPQEPVVSVLQRAAQYVMGKSPRLSKYTFATDATYLGPIAKIPTVGFGTGDEANAHSVNDHVKIDDLVVASKVYALSVKL